MPDKIYFAYGSNLNRNDWRRWCEVRGHSPDLLRYRSIGYLPDHDVRFSHYSPTRRGGVLDIEPRVGQFVPGVIFDVAGDGWEALDEKEGVPNSYRPVAKTVVDDRGDEVAATTYEVTQLDPRSFVKPTPEYVRVVRDGLESHDLPTAAVEAASLNERTAPLVDAFFVYGTLMRRESRSSALKSHGVTCALLAKTFGRLFDLGDYPALIDLASTDSMVRGDFIRVSDPEMAIGTLDEIEGFEGFGLANSLYRRTLCQVDVGEGRIRQAWTYCWAARSDRAISIASGDWREHRGQRDAFLDELARVHSQGNERRVAMGIAKSVPFNFDPDVNAVAQSLLPLNATLAAGTVSERLLAQQSGIWTALA